jgi:hypothetical protein
MPALFQAAALVAGVALAATSAGAAEPSSADGATLKLRTSFKGSLLSSEAADAPPEPRESDAATSFWRVRLEPEARLGPRVSLAFAYEHRLRISSPSESAGALGVLPPEGDAPYRIRPLDWQISRSSRATWRHEIDRAYVGIHLPGVELTAGRQAVGWGRGVLFGAVELFAPFTPLEADREWRRGVDALRADFKLSNRASLDVVGAFGDTLDASTLAARLRGYAGKADLEVVAGRRARDLFAGVTSSAAVGDAEIHGEIAVFRAPEALPGAGERRVALKAVAGGSHRFAVANGLLVWAEYHYSGFGLRSAADIPARMADPAFRQRYLRGDSQILGRHAIGLLASLEVSPELTVGGQWIQSPADGSGVVAPSATVTFGDSLSLLATAYLPFGRAWRGSVRGSEYGAAPRAVFVQVRIYD